jgi:hypothetical protein
MLDNVINVLVEINHIQDVAAIRFSRRQAEVQAEVEAAKTQGADGGSRVAAKRIAKAVSQ